VGLSVGEDVGPSVGAGDVGYGVGDSVGLHRKSLKTIVWRENAA
jgi:hypothetical protein